MSTSSTLGYATRSLYASKGQRAEGVPTSNQRGRGYRPCALQGSLDKSRHIVPNVLLVRVQRFKKDLYKTVEGPSTIPIVLSKISWSYFRRHLHLPIFEPDETKFAAPFFICRKDHHRRPVERFHYKHIFETTIHQIQTKVQSVTWRTFVMFFEALWYL